MTSIDHRTSGRSYVGEHMRTAYIGADDIEYAARVFETDVTDGGGALGARYVCTQYVRTDIPPDERSRRPVIFSFNGGPGSASVWTHLGIGPRRIAQADSLTPVMTPPFGLLDNVDSPLDVADLVFVDPPGTGYSRLLDPSKAEAFHGTDQDARATIEFIETWARRNRRQNSPRFLLGESFGTVRAARIARNASGGPFLGGATRAAAITGVIILGPALGHWLPEWSGDVRDALEVPTYAATARYHSGMSVPPEEVARFARTELLPALAAGAELPHDERRAIAVRLAEILALDVQVVLDHDLRIPPTQYARLVREHAGEHVGLYDSRYTLPAEGAGHDAVTDDPGMGQYAPAFLGTIERYLHEELGYVTDEDYRGIAFADVYANWDYGDGADAPKTGALEELAAVLRRDRRFEVLIGVGDYDLVTTSASTEFAVARCQVDRSRVHLHRYASGHMPYLGAEPRQSLARDLREFVTRLSRHDGSRTEAV